MNILKKKILVGRHRQTILLMKRPLRQWIFSKAVRKFGLNIVTREEILNNSEKYHVRQFGSVESIVISEPHKGSDEMPRLTEAIGSFSLKERFVAEVTNAELVGSAAVGFSDQDGSLISEIITGKLKSFNRLPARTLILRKLPSFGTTQQVDVACSLVNPSSKGYFPWIANLTRLEGLEYYQKQTGIKPVLIVDANPTRWQRESLRLLGYKPEDCIPWNSSRIKIKRLVVPSYCREQALISPSACRWLRQRLVSNLPLESEKRCFSPRIYIARTKTTGRRITNEDEVLSNLIPLGFVPYRLESMSFADQVRLLSQAEIVIAPHGAGLANIIFAQNLRVIELFGSYGTAAYFVLSKALDFHYACLVSDPKGKNQVSERYTDMTVDIAKLRALVTEMLSLGGDRHP